MANAAVKIDGPELPPLVRKITQGKPVVFVELHGLRWNACGRELFGRMNEALGFGKVPFWPSVFINSCEWASERPRVALGNWERSFQAPEARLGTTLVSVVFTYQGPDGYTDTMYFQQWEDGTFYVCLPVAPGLFFNNVKAAEAMLDFQRLVLTAPTTLDV